MHEKEIEKLNAEIADNERQLVQLRHKQQQLENRAVYYEKGDRRKRAHRLITRGAVVESIAPLAKVLGEAEFYDFAEKALVLPDVKALLMKAVNEHYQKEIGGVTEYRTFSFSCDADQAQRRTVCRSCCRLSRRRKTAQ